MRKLIRYFFRLKLSDRLPRIPRMYSTDYNPRLVDHDTANLMRMTAIRSPQGAEILKKRHKTNASRDLVHLLPLQKPRRRRRLMPLLRRIEGTTPYDPLKRWAARAKGKR